VIRALRTGGRRRLWSVTLALAAVLPATVPARAVPPAPGGPYRVQLVYRVTSSLAPFEIAIHSKGTHAYGFWSVLEIQRQGRGWRQGAGFTMVAQGGSAAPIVYGAPYSPLPPCPDGPACSYPDAGLLGGSGAIVQNVRPQATSRYYVISAYDTTTVEVPAGWRVKDVHDVGVRRVLADHSAGSVGVGAGQHVEHFTGAVAAGGRYGSAVFASVPCDGGGVGSARLMGHGALDVSGLTEPGPLSCSATARGGAFAWAYTPLQTTWRLDGDVTGIGEALTRLLVFDFPKP
jgi:hypothetical protein